MYVAQGCKGAALSLRERMSQEIALNGINTQKHAYTLTHEAHLYAIGIPFLVCVFCDLCVEIFLVSDFIITIQYDEYGHLIGGKKKFLMTQSSKREGGVRIVPTSSLRISISSSFFAPYFFRTFSTRSSPGFLMDGSVANKGTKGMATNS